VYHSKNLKVQFAQQLYEAGFRDVSVQDSCGCTPLAIVIANCRGTSGAALWLVDNGAEGNLGDNADMPNCLHILAHVKNNQLLEHTHDTQEFLIDELAALEKVCNVAASDSCFCYCSSSGCTPLSILLRRTPLVKINRRMGWVLELPQYIPECLILTEECFANICRLEIFERLGMTHGCCRTMIATFYPTPYARLAKSHENWKDEDRREVQDDEAEFRDILEAYMQLYHGIPEEFERPFAEFWLSWWNTVEACLPELTSGFSSPTSTASSTGFGEATRADSGDLNCGSGRHLDFGPDEEFRSRFISVATRYRWSESDDERNSWETISSSQSEYSDSSSIIIRSKVVALKPLETEQTQYESRDGHCNESGPDCIDSDDNESDDTESNGINEGYQEYYQRFTSHRIDPRTGCAMFSI
jgi:hypothetical protein